MINNNEGSEVQFNDAISLVYRLDKLQQELNQSYTNLLAIDEKGVFEYENFINNLDNIYFEICADLTKAEDEEVLDLQNAIKVFKKELPFIEQVKTNGFGNYNSSLQLNNINFELFKELLKKYRILINQLKKKHGYSNPIKENNRRAMSN